MKGDMGHGAGRVRQVRHLHRAQPLDGLRGRQPQRARRAHLLHVLQRGAWRQGRPRRPGLLGRSVLEDSARPRGTGHRQPRQDFRRAVLQHERSGLAREGRGRQRYLRAHSQAWEPAALALAEEVGERRAQCQLGEHAWRPRLERTFGDHAWRRNGGRLDQLAGEIVPSGHGVLGLHAIFRREACARSRGDNLRTIADYC